jgi:hypothetical protein
MRYSTGGPVLLQLQVACVARAGKSAWRKETHSVETQSQPKIGPSAGDEQAILGQRGQQKVSASGKNAENRLTLPFAAV